MAPDRLVLPLAEGGRGTLRAAELAVFDSVRPADGFSLLAAVDVPLRAVEFSEARADCAVEARAELAGGVILLTVGRDIALDEGCAAACPAFGPSMLARVGLTPGLPRLGALFTAFAGTWTILLCTDCPFFSVLAETAVNPPGLVMLAK